MMKQYGYPKTANWKSLCERPLQNQKNLSEQVKSVFDKVKNNGDKALKWYTEKFDGVVVNEFKVSKSEIEEAKKSVSNELKSAIKTASENIRKFHNSQQEEKKIIETTEGVFCWRESRAIENIGIYIPGGTAPLFSTVLMLAIPANIAACKNIALCSPPDKDGKINPAILFAADLVGIKNIFKVGGSQAIAGLTFGTETIPKVDKIFGPGNQYVTAAKQLALNYNIAIDIPAGPSEVLVIADESSIPEFVASDLLSQAEHGTDSQVILLSDSERVINEINIEIEKQLAELPRKEIAEIALENSKAILLNSINEAIEFSNLYAPEHLILSIENAENFTDKIKNAGSVFLGNYSPESAGDYASGTNHTLPTNGFAKNYSGVSLDSFVKKVTFQNITKNGIKNIGKTIELMAEAEELMAHKNAISVRLKYLENENDIQKLVRKNILNLKPYSSARDEFEGENGIFLDANENPFGELNRYPDPYQRKIKQKLSELNQIPTENIFFGNGSDEVIELAFRIFCEPGNDKVLTFSPTYGMYEVSANINDVELIKLDLNEDFQIGLETLKPYLNDENLKIIFICSPNNPTGNSIKNIEYVLENFNGIIFIDEAYIDFSPEQSFRNQIKNYPNLIVSQTFSKAWGMASVRVGIAYASEEIIKFYNKVKPPYNISQPNQNAILKILSDENIIQVSENIKLILNEKKLLIQNLEELKLVIKIFPSDANFILIEVENADGIYQKLVEENVIVRNRNSVIKNCLRITVGSPEENEKLIETLREIKF